MRYLSIVAIAKNEGVNFKEWLDYHISIGVEHFYIYDNCSTDNTKDVLKPYIDSGVVTYRYWDFEAPCQLTSYNNALDLYKEDSRWIAFIDIDEFLKPISKSLPEVLKNYEEFGGLGVNWLIYGSSGHDRRPDGGILENYKQHSNYDFSANLHIKSIVNPRAVKEFINPHFCTFNDGHFCVNENKEIISGPWTKAYSGNVIRINHYYCKSKEDFELKQSRGRADLTNCSYDYSSFCGHDKNDICEG
jgi:hypothetical protein